MKQRVLAFDGRKVRRLSVEAPGPIRWASWNGKEGRALLVGDRGTMISYDGGHFHHIKSVTGENLRCVSVSSRDGSAYACGNKGTVVKVEGETATVLHLHIRETLRRLAWDPTGSRLLMVGNGGAAYVFRPDGSLRKLDGAETHLRSISWHPNSGRALVTGNCFRDSIGGLTPSPNLFEFHDDSLTEVSTLEESRSDLTSSSWRPDGSSCLLAGFDQTWHSPTLLEYSDGMAEGVPWKAENVLPTACSWRPDGSYALLGTSAMTSEEGPAALYRYDGSGVTIVEDLDGFGVSSITWSGDGALLACSRRNRAFTS